MRPGPFALGVVLVAVALAACGGTRKAVQPGEAQTTGAEAPTAPTGPVTMSALPAGTSLTVRVVDPISSESASAGTKFAAVLAAPVSTSSGEVAIPEGTKLFGHVTEARAGGAVKKPKLAIVIDQLQVEGRMVSVATTAVGAEGERGGVVKKIGGGALLGAAGGSAGAGAAAGGAAAVLSQGNEIVIRPGTLIEVRLTQPASIR